MREEKFQPMRSLIYVDVAHEDYRIKLENWLYRYHIADSMSQFGPYVSKYAFYQALPVPPGGERFGTVKMQLTEHYWLLDAINAQKAIYHNKTLVEYFPKDVLIWQGNMPDIAHNEHAPENKAEAEILDADKARQTTMHAPGTVPFIFAFVPVWWEDDLKGAGRTIEDGPNYRWQFMFNYPEGVSKEEGDKWVKEEFLQAFVDNKHVNRVLSSAIIKEVNDCEFDRVCEIWFDSPTDWQNTINEVKEVIKKPSFATEDDFPYFEKAYGIIGIFLSDIARSDNYSQYHGFITMR